MHVKNRRKIYRSRSTRLSSSTGGASTSMHAFHRRNGWPSSAFLYATSTLCSVGGLRLLQEIHPFERSFDSCDRRNSRMGNIFPWINYQDHGVDDSFQMWLCVQQRRRTVASNLIQRRSMSFLQARQATLAQHVIRNLKMKKLLEREILMGWHIQIMALYIFLFIFFNYDNFKFNQPGIAVCSKRSSEWGIDGQPAGQAAPSGQAVQFPCGHALD